jgi:hypothetical protein
MQTSGVSTGAGRRRVGAVLLAILAILALSAGGSGCTQHAPEARRPASSATTTTTPPATQAAREVPNDHALGAALPGPAQVGGIGGYTSCVSGEQVCYPAFSAEQDPSLSWVKAADGAGPFVLGGPVPGR